MSANVKQSLSGSINGVSQTITGTVGMGSPKIPTGMYIPNPEEAEIGQTIVVKAVDESGKPTEWEATDFPSSTDEYTLPAATSDNLGGVKADPVESADTQPVRIDANGKLWTTPSETGGISVTGAQVGQTIKIAAVDENGVPTAWEAVDAKDGTTPHIGDNGNWWIGETDTGVSAGGNGASGGKWEHICDITTTEEIDAGITITENADGVPLADLKYTEIWIMAKMVGVSTNTNNWWSAEISTDSSACNANCSVAGGTAVRKYISHYAFIRGGKAYGNDGGADVFATKGGDQNWLNNYLDYYNCNYFSKIRFLSDSTRIIGADTEIRILGRKT